MDGCARACSKNAELEMRTIQFFSPAAVDCLPDGLEERGPVDNGRTATVPRYASPNQKPPYWVAAPRDPKLIFIVCAVGHPMPFPREMIAADGKVGERINLNGCQASMRCPRRLCAMNSQHVTLKDYEA